MSTAKVELLDALAADAYAEGEFLLASGRTSSFFIDCKRVTLLASGHRLVGQACLEVIAEAWPEAKAVAGVALGGCPIASAVAFASALSDGSTLDAVYVRKAAKAHGSKKLIEGAQGLATNDPIVLLEDTVTTGGSSIKAVNALKEAGLNVAGVLALVDREEGAAQAFSAAGIDFSAMFSVRDVARRHKERA